MRAYAPGAGLALLAGLHKGLLASLPTNDDFMHRTYARQLLAGEWPLRDFFDYGMGLMYLLSALADQVFGHRLLSEAVIIGVATAISTFLVYAIVRRDTGSSAAAVLGSLFLVLAGPRGFSYPKLIIYAVAAYLWWQYVRQPRARTAIAMGAWTAIAYYWRPDHGLYVAVGVTLATLAAHGPRVPALARSTLAGAVTIALVLPFWVFAATQVGFASFVRSGVTAAGAQHGVSQAGPRWPLRRLEDLFAIDPPDVYAPRIGIRWSRDSSGEARAAVLGRHGLTVESTEDEQSQRVRLSERSLLTLRELIANPIVEDTAGVTRSSAALPWETWPAWDRWRFNAPWLRLRLFPGVDEHTQAGAVAQVLLYCVPMIAIVIGLVPAARRHLPPRVVGGHLAAFAVFAIVVNIGLIRTPYEIRANDAVVLPGIVFGICIATIANAGARGPRAGRWLLAPLALACTLLMMKSLAVTGEFASNMGWLTGEFRSLARARGAWQGARDRLWAEPPFEFWRDREGPLTSRLAQYAHACVPPAERVLVLWFAPEIYYQSDRLMAGRHLHFTPAFRGLPDERRLELEKVRRTAPPVVFAKSALDGPARTAFPELVGYVHGEYEPAATIADEGEEYAILVRRARVPRGRYGQKGWPCYR
jgi:hypothetical protein